MPTSKSRNAVAKANGIIDIREARLGVKGDGATADQAAFAAALTTLAAEGFGTIRIPPGTYLFDDRLIAGTTMPNGIHLVGVGARAGGLNYLQDQVIFKFTGANAYLFDIRNALGTLELGNWAFENIAFQATQATGGIFSINYLTQAGITYVPTDDATTPNYVLDVRFKNCRFWGAQAGATQAGDAIRACKTFDIIIDDDCRFRGWRRAVFGMGCDNANVAGKYAGNGRHIHLESSGNFGNEGVIMHPVLKDCSETVDGTAAAQGFPLYLVMRNVNVFSPEIEPAVGAAKAQIYTNGLKTTIYSPMFTTGVPIWQLGSGAKNIAIIDAKAGGSVTEPIYSDAETADYGGSGYDYSVKLIAPSPEVYTALRPNPRLRVIHSTQLGPYLEMYGPSNFLIDANGPRQKQISMTAFNYFGRSAGYAGLEGGVVLSSDDNAFFGTGVAASFTGYTIQLPAGNGGFGIRLFVGKQIQNGDTVRTTIWYRGAGDPTFALRIRELLNGVAGGATNPAYSATYTKAVHTFTVAAVRDDEYTIQIYNAGGDKAAYVTAVLIEVLDPANADTSGATLGQLETEVNELKATMRKFGMLAD